jgi:hypothetical protein
MRVYLINLQFIDFDVLGLYTRLGFLRVRGGEGCVNVCVCVCLHVCFVRMMQDSLKMILVLHYSSSINVKELMVHLNAILDGRTKVIEEFERNVACWYGAGVGVGSG